jgi:Ser/Thr protein kinase RdoA (MazF antagonist)
MAPSPDSPPALHPEELALELFGVRGSAHPQPSYLDRNFRIDAEDGRRFLLRIAHAGEDRDALAFQHRLLERLAAAGLPTPRVVRTRAGDDLASVATPEGERWLRLHTWIEGRTLATVARPADALLADLGRLLGRVDRALEGAEAPARALEWDALRAGHLRAELGAVPDPARRARLEGVLDAFEARLGAELAALPRCVVHNDANEHNVLVRGEDEEVELCGLTDFGDALHTLRLAEPVVAATYAMLQRGWQEAARAGRAVLDGYREVVPLEPRELARVVDLVELRLVTSVVVSARSRAAAPDNEYISVTEPHAWAFLDRLGAVDRSALLSELVGSR